MDRYNRLKELFISMNKKEPKLDDEYILECLTKLKDVYDHNFEKSQHAHSFEHKQAYLHRCDLLDVIGINLQKLLHIYIYANEEREEKKIAEPDKMEEEEVYEELESLEEYLKKEAEDVVSV